MKHIKLFEAFEPSFDQDDYSNTKNNPDRIVIKFASGGLDKFWNQYIKSTDPKYYRGTGENWVYFNSWSNLVEHFSSEGLEMKDGEYYLLFKNYDPNDVSDWQSNGRREGQLPATFYFVKYNKEAGEIGIYSVYGTEYQHVKANEEFYDDKLKGMPQHIYCRFDKGDIASGTEVARLVEPGSVDHRGYFEVVSVK